MIDSLYLYSYEFAPIGDEWKQKIIKSGDVIEMEIFYINDDLVNLEYGWFLNDSGGKVLIPLRIHFSLPKLQSGGRGNYELLLEDIDELLKLVENELRDRVYVSLEDMKVGRLDIYKNMFDLKGEEVIPFLMSLRFNRRYKRLHYVNDGVENLTWMNKSRELGIYDKRVEMLKKYKTDIGRDVVRSEVRLKKHKVVQELGIDVLQDVIEALKEGVTIRRYYNTQIEKILNISRDHMCDIGLLDWKELQLYALGYMIDKEGWMKLEYVARKGVKKRAFYKRLEKLKKAYELYKQHNLMKRRLAILDKIFYDVA